VVKTGGFRKFFQSLQADEANEFTELSTTTLFGLCIPQLIEESACFRIGTRIAQPSVFEEVRMSLETIPILIFLMIPLLSGLGLIGDALRRAFQDMQRADHNLHPQPGPKLI
jgi:hypothetical protein